MVKRVIIIGGHIQALGLARQTAHLGIPVVLFIEGRYSVARFSKAVSRTIVFRSNEGLAKSLKQYEDSGTMLFPTSDDYVEYFATNYKELNKHFILAIPDPNTVALFGNKRKTYQYAKQAGIPHPHSWYPNTLKDVESIALEVAYPVVVKPAVMYSFHKMFGKKAFRCDTPSNLLNKCRMINEKMSVSNLVIQEFLSGGAKALYSFGTFVVDGIPKAWIMANRIRQNPMDFGNSTTFAISCSIPAIEESARMILRQNHYTGLAEVEFMYDEKRHEYKFLEINTRAWKWHSISLGLGYGFLTEWIHWLNGEKGEFKAPASQIAWVERLTDMAIILKESLRGRMKLKDAIKTYQQEKVSAVWSWNDPLPGLMYILMSPILYFKRY